jgi:DNA helicase-2/ATP-dependent DNA helicase PcrA
MLSDIQKEIVEYIDTPCVVSAGAGSGKSRVITYKFEYLVNKININPDEILCITFTNKAANELKTRLSNKLNLNLMQLKWVRTIHSACYKLIKENLEIYGFNKSVSIYTDYEKKKILKNLLKDTSLEKKDVIPFFLELINKSKLIDFKNEDELINLIFDPLIPTVFKNTDKFTFNRENHNLIYDTFIKYIFEMKNRQCLDYDDILFYTKRLLNDDVIFKSKIQQQFKYILVDEYQDVDPTQNYIIKNIVTQNNITIVGDDAQSIYKFRGSEPKLFINYTTTFPTAKLFKLEQNYRSSKQIINAASTLIKNNTQQIPKTCYSIKEGILPNIKKFENYKEEALSISRACLNLHTNTNIEYKDIAIIYRTRMISRSIEKHLIKLGIPYVLVGDVEFFERREIKDIMSYLEFSHNKNNKSAFDRSIISPRRGVSTNTLEGLLLKCVGDTLIDKLKYLLYNFNLNKKQFLELSKYINLIISMDLNTPEDAIQKIISNEKFTDYIKNVSNDDEDFAQRKENMDELVNMASEFATISEFLEDVFLNYTNKKSKEVSSVQLMTGHASKGLEFKIVFLVGAEEHTIPHIRSLIEKNPILRKENIEEERRLFYVMMTRAETLLNITWCENRSCGFNLKRSRFVDEIEKYINKI